MSLEDELERAHRENDERLLRLMRTVASDERLGAMALAFTQAVKALAHGFRERGSDQAAGLLVRVGAHFLIDQALKELRGEW